jgi:hypothetical protein
LKKVLHASLDESRPGKVHRQGKFFVITQEEPPMTRRHYIANMISADGYFVREPALDAIHT